ncbi:MAG: 2-C-methyl-D-erythritol 4-phosphate cytidylyltransferase [Desulfobacterales bacterium]|jgi:2-C-methyl-D-erythritol 4-phosphate cytidylyltransferase|nr:2-C-methyl-D-erythritol 4-phosphate cytidylyltransferase [Desulfobacterales bacterium]
MAYALIVAAGKGTRLPGPQPKQYLPLAGVPILTRTLRSMEAGATRFEAIVLVVPAADIGYCRERILAAAGLRTPVTLVAGGERRQDSVYRGLRELGPDDAVVAIHDGARPLVPAPLIDACVQTALRSGACIAGLPVWETVKLCGAGGLIASTLPREAVWLAQTPQAFRIGLIRRAHEQARQDGFYGTDDAALVERLGAPVHVIPGSRRNIKITTREDLWVAEALAAQPLDPQND